VSVPVDQFIARLLEHVPPGDMQMVRPYGLYANSKRAELGRAREQFGQEPKVSKETLGWTEFCEQYGIEPTSVCTCPQCGARFVRLGTFAAGRDPPVEAAGQGRRAA
jgi:hypothetical protein